MAAPHAAGVAALIVSRYGFSWGRSGFGLWPDAVKWRLMQSAVDNPCPAGGVIEYTNEGRDASYTSTCTGSADFNSLYGAGIVNAYRAVR